MGTENATFDVRIWKTEVYKGSKVTTYRVRWATGSAQWKESFRTRAQARSFESELRSAVSRGASFDLTTGRPFSSSTRENDMPWYDFCVSYVDMKWKGSAAKRRSTIAWALVTIMPAMIESQRRMPYDSKEVRSALRQWGFNTKQRPDCPADIAEILTWLSRNTRPVSALTKPEVLRGVLERAVSLAAQDRPASAWVSRSNRAILKNALEYAVERKILASNPLSGLKWTEPKTTRAVDRRCVVNPGQARRLLDAVGQQMPSGPRLVAYFGVMYYSALRPEEAVTLSEENLSLPPLVWSEEAQAWEEPADGWGDLWLCSAWPETGREWTDDGAIRDKRQLKSRAVGEWRRAPVPPPLTRLLRAHLDQFGIRPGGRLFTGVRGGELASITSRRVWDKARKTALTPAEYASPLARRAYDLRHAAVSTWLNGGVAPAQVAEWAGHSVAVLLKVYAQCIDGQDQAARQRIDEALRWDSDPG